MVDWLCSLSPPTRIAVLAVIFTGFAVMLLMVLADVMNRRSKDPKRRDAGKKNWHQRHLEDAEAALLAAAYEKHEADSHAEDGHHGK